MQLYVLSTDSDTNRPIQSNGSVTCVPRHLSTGVYVCVVVAVVLAIVGGTTATYSPILFHAKIESKIAILILISLFMILLVVNALLLFRLRHLPPGEHPPLLAVTAGSPFLASRLAYACTSAFKVSQTFNPLVGNVWVLAFMSVFDEFVVALLYSFASMKTPLREGSSEESSSEPSTSYDAPVEDSSGNPNDGNTTPEQKGQCDSVGSGRNGAFVENEKTVADVEGPQEIASDVGLIHKQSNEDLDLGKALVEPGNAGIEMESVSRGGYIIESDKSHVLRDTKIEAGVSDVLATADSRTLAVVEKG